MQKWDGRVWLNFGELTLIDWCICAYSHVLPDTLDELTNRWGLMRSRVWQSLSRLPQAEPAKETPIVLSESDCMVLSALLPSTFHWGGAGADCGFSLKAKLAAVIRGEYDHQDLADHQADDPASNTAGEKPGLVS